MLASYDYDYLARIKDIFGVTDFWAMYSWGFNDETEKPDREFFLSKLDNFSKAGIKVHAYIQGPNVAYNDFKDRNWYARDVVGNRITYYRGRDVVCLNNPEFLELTINRIQSLRNENVGGIFIDNIQMGQLGLPTYKKGEPFVFVGCTCAICRRLFFERTGESIPLDFEKDRERAKEYLQFRVESTNKYLQTLADATHAQKMEFGSNSFDPKFPTQYMFGTDLKQLAKIQDYVLFETHNLPSSNKHPSAAYIQAEMKGANVPVFHISYRYGIGYDAEFTQEDIDYTFTEADHYGFYPLIKGSEYITNGVWHNLDVTKLKKPRRDVDFHPHMGKIKSKQSTPIPRVLRVFLSRRMGLAFTLFMESRLVRRLLGWVYSKVV